VVTGGSGRLEYDGGELTLASGQTFVAPAAAGPLRFRGVLTALVCLPPEL
jgi:mannose-6-phosphate isomerase class I